MSKPRLEITARVLAHGQPFTVFGRDAWALSELIEVGRAGASPIDNPGPRWSTYVHALRHERGLDIQTINEAHASQFAGTHARYVLHSPVQIISRNDRAELARVA